ncbi:MAG: hypothetical protein KatS3mg102_0690 [Planctomycetota bacterium]|nr:MAG: hypothetical protein KatS3mg102_0690 [Planctomycetota bacterium]
MPHAASPARAHPGGKGLLVGIVLGVVLGGAAGALWPGFGAGIYFVGELFLRALMVMVVPLVVASMIAGIAALGDVRHLGGIGGRTIAYYMATTAIAVTIGLLAVNLVRPGAGVRPGEVHPELGWRVEGHTVHLEGGRLERPRRYDQNFEVVLTTPGGGRVRGVIEGTAPRSATELRVQGWTDAASGAALQPPRRGRGLEVRPVLAARVREKAGAADRSFVAIVFATVRQVLVGLVPNNLFEAMAQTQLLPVIVFSLFFGAVLTTLGDKGRHVLGFFDGVNDAIMKMVGVVMLFAPAGIFALVAGRIGEEGGFAGFYPQLVEIGRYFLTVVLGLAVHGLVVLPLILWWVGRRSPFAYAAGMAEALLTAFSTASSSATLPVTIENAERQGVSERSASFVLPLGATINMDGTAMYEAVAALFIAQAFGVPLGLPEMLVVFLTATLAAIGAAGIPEAGLVTMVIVLQAVGLPLEGVSLILVVDWLLDRFRTTVNVWGDAVGAAVIDRLESRRARARRLRGGPHARAATSR